MTWGCALAPSEVPTGTELGEDDAEFDDLTPGKADTGGLQENTPDACGVLRVANGLTATKLKSSVKLTTTAANNIAAYRRGDDELASTSDDETFDSLAELDAVPYVGPVAFGKLLSYATSNGYVAACAVPPPDCFNHWEAGNCPAPTVTRIDVQAATYINGVPLAGRVCVVGDHFQQARLGKYQLRSQSGLFFAFTAEDSLTYGRRPLTSQYLCRYSWEPFPSEPLALVNADGQVSNAVAPQVVQAIAVPTSDSNDPFAPGACMDPEIKDLGELFATGEVVRHLPTLATQQRTRQCSAQTGCTAWGEITAGSNEYAGLQATGTEYRVRVGSYTESYTPDMFGGFFHNRLGLHVAKRCARYDRYDQTAGPNNTTIETHRAAVVRW